MILNLINNPILFAAYIVSFVVCLSMHEFAHAWAATALGDPTPKEMGRLSLNPIKHIDPIGTIFFFIVGFGWGNPVVFNPQNFKNEKLDAVLVALAGPLANLIIAIVLGLIFRMLPVGSPFAEFLLLVIAINIIWMVFNLIPIPPLDGSHILNLFLPPNVYYTLQQIGLPILLILLLFSPYIRNIISAVLGFFLKMLTGQNINLF